MKKSRFLVVLLSVVLIFGLMPTNAMDSYADPPEPSAIPMDNLIADYSFVTKPEDGKTVANGAAGSTLSAAVVQNDAAASWSDKALVFTGGGTSNTPTAPWVLLPNNILQGKTEATITTEVKVDSSMLDAYNFLWCIGNSGTAQHWFASVRNNPRAVLKTAKTNNTEVNAYSPDPLEADRWYSFTSVIKSDGTIQLYLDGKLVGEGEANSTPADVTDQSRNTIARAPYNDPVFKGAMSNFRVYDRALSAAEVKAISDADSTIHNLNYQPQLDALLAKIGNVVITDSTTVLPDYGGTVRWKSNMAGASIAADGVTLTVAQPAKGEGALSGTLTATATIDGRGTAGLSDEKTVNITVKEVSAAEDKYGYLMVHFIEDSAGYQEKVYLDISRGDNPEQWDPLNGGKPILASNKVTTGTRDPFLTYNPETKTYYIIATDLRVFGGDGGGWGVWNSSGSTMINIWESKDLIHWGESRQFDVAANKSGEKIAELGMMWAPEATWVPDYYGEGKGAFVMYWSSQIFTNSAHTGSTYARVLWGATTDFTQDTYEYGGVFVDNGAGDTIDTTIAQNAGKTYRITKENGRALGATSTRGIFMEVTSAKEWWKPEATWTVLQTAIGAAHAGGSSGGVEGPATFKHNRDDKWYLYVDVIPSIGYRPLVTTDLDSGWSILNSPDFYMAPSTKHGGVISLTKAQYDAIRGADATSAVTSNLGDVAVAVGASTDNLKAALPEKAEVNLAYGRGKAECPVKWDISSVNLSKEGVYSVTGTIDEIGANLNQWVGKDGSTAWNAADKTLYSSTEINVIANVKVGNPLEGGVLDDYVITANYDMSHTGTTLTDISGNGFDAPLTGLTTANFSDVDGDDILTFPNSAGDRYAKLPNGIILDENFAVEVKYTSAASNTNALIWNIGTRRAANTQPQTLNNFLNVHANVGGLSRVALKDSSLDGERSFSGGTIATGGDFTTLLVVFEDGVVTAYQDGAKIGTLSSKYSIQDILDTGVSNPSDAIGYIGRSFSTTNVTANNFRGTLTSFKVYNKTFSDEDVLARAASTLIIPNADDVRGNVTLKDETNTGVKISWTSSNEAVVSTQVKPVANYDDIPAGVVTRPAGADANVTLTATLSYKGKTETKVFNLTIKKAPAPAGVASKFLFTHFTGDEGTANAEQVYFAVSKDGLNFRDMSAVNDPIMTSTVGEKGVRDMCMIRSAEGDRFYLIATDLSIYYRARGWGDGNNASTTGSQKIVVWESEDLANWSAPRLARVAPHAAGMAWAPEGYYDEKTGEYVVFWSSTMNGRTQVYYAKTRDFYSFTEAKPFVESTDVIDATVTEVGDYYYRASKYGGNGSSNIFLQRVSKEDGMLGTWTDYISLAGSKNSTVTSALPYYANGGAALEGPEFYKLANGDVILMADRYGNGTGYQPFLLKDIEDTSTWSVMPAADFNYGSVKKRHGNIIPITDEQYMNVLEAYTDGHVTGITLDPSSLTTYIGATNTITPKLTPADPVDNDVTWSSSDTKIATVSAAGQVTGVRAGTATITAKTVDGGLTATCQVTVETAPPAPTVLAYFDFNTAAVSNVFSSKDGTDAKATAQGATATYLTTQAKGTGYPTGDRALYLRGATTSTDTRNAFLRVTNLAGNALLTGKQEITISYDANPSRTATNWPIFLSASTAANVEGNLNYVGFFNQPSTTTIERFKTSRTGPSAVADTGAINVWNHIDVVLSAKATKIYVNGFLKSEVSASAAQNLPNILGNTSNFQIGRAQWGTNGEYFNGMLDNIAVYDRELIASEIRENYYATTSTTNVASALSNDALAVRLPGSVISDIDLPETGASGSKIVWATSDSASITAEGVVTRPADASKKVTLTATFSLAGQQIVKAYEITVLAEDDQATLDYLVDNYDLGIQYVTGNITLADTLGSGTTVAWSAAPAGIIAADGKVNRPAVGDGDKDVKLTAVFTLGGATMTKSYDVTVAEADYGNLLTYIRTTTPELTSAMYLAAKKTNETAFAELNSGKPIRYAKLGAKRMLAPSIFRKPDGSYGAVASNNNTGDSVLIFDSKNLIDFTGERLLKLNNNSIAVTNPYVVYDNGIRAYRIYWTGGGKNYETVTDLTNIIAINEKAAPSRSVSGTVPSGASQATSIGVTRAEYDAVVKKFSRIFNTEVQSFEAARVPKDASIAEIEKVLPGKAELTYSDGSSKYLGVEWDQSDLAAIDGKGTYEIDGTVVQKDYGDPYIKYRADPYVTKGDGKGTNDDYYYFTASYPRVGNHASTVPADGGYDRVVLRRSKTLEGLADVGQNVYANTDNPENQEIVIWNQANSTTDFRNVWAPEIHKINGRWYVIFTTSNSSSDQYGVRCAIIGCYGDGDPFKPENWKAANPDQANQTGATRFQPVTGDTVAAMGNAVPFGQFSLDMTYFEHKGTHYVVWAQKPSSSNLLIASIDPERPWVLTSKAQLISVPDYPWEINTGQGQLVDEGAAFMAYGDKVFIAFSGSTVDERYCIGLLSADTNADLLDPASWTKGAYPALATEDLVDQAGPGHNSFTVDEFGNPIIVYHARTPGDIAAPVTGGTAAAATDGGLGDPRRHARIKPVHFTADGDIYYSMRPEEELAPANRNVKITVVVGSGQKAPANVAVLQATVALNENRYKENETTAQAWADFTKAINDAKAIIAAPDDYNQAQADAAQKAIEDAVAVIKANPISTLVLEIYIDIAKEYLDNENLYIKSAVTALKAALAAAEETLVTRESQAKIDKAMDDIDAVLGTLYEKGDLVKVSGLVSFAGTLTQGDFTEESWAAVSKALAAADKVVLKGDDASDQEADFVYEQLMNAILGLKDKVVLNYYALDSAIARGDNIAANADKYVASSITGLSAALTAAKSVRSNATTQKAIDDATVALATVIAKARLKANLSDLQSLLGHVQSLNLSLYTEESAAPVRALSAKAAKLTEEDSQQAVDMAAYELSAAVNALEKKPAGVVTATPPKSEGTVKSPAKAKADKSASGGSKAATSKKSSTKNSSKSASSSSATSGSKSAASAATPAANGAATDAAAAQAGSGAQTNTGTANASAGQDNAAAIGGDAAATDTKTIDKSSVPAAQAEGGLPLYVWIALLLAVAVIGGLGLFFARRRHAKTGAEK